MRQTTIKEIATWLQCETRGEALITGVSVDNRNVKQGDLFVCLQGAKVDGHTFAQSAIDKGATCLLVDHYLDLDCPQILVSDTLQGLSDIASAYRDTLDATFIVISGSNGKTSTKDMFLSCLSEVGPTIATLENQNTEIGACLNLFRMDGHTRFGIFEAGLDDPGDLPKITCIIKPDYAILTSLDQAHMDNFGTMEALGKEKFTLFDGIDPAVCYYNGDSEIYRSLAYGQHPFGLNKDNEFVVAAIDVKQEGVSFTVNDDAYCVNLLGKHQAINAGAVVAVLKAMNISNEVISKGLKQVALTKMRTEVYKHHEALIIFDAYKSSPQSAMAAIDVAAAYPTDTNRFVVMADMYSLGEGSEQRHQEVLDHMLAYPFEKYYLFGEEFGKVVKTYNDNRIMWYDDFEDLKNDVTKLYQQDCLIVFKGSRYYELERLLEEGVK